MSGPIGNHRLAAAKALGIVIPDAALVIPDGFMGITEEFEDDQPGTFLGEPMSVADLAHFLQAAQANMAPLAEVPEQSNLSYHIEKPAVQETLDGGTSLPENLIKRGGRAREQAQQAKLALDIEKLPSAEPIYLTADDIRALGLVDPGEAEQLGEDALEMISTVESLGILDYPLVNRITTDDGRLIKTEVLSGRRRLLAALATDTEGEWVKAYQNLKTHQADDIILASNHARRVAWIQDVRILAKLCEEGRSDDYILDRFRAVTTRNRTYAKPLLYMARLVAYPKVFDQIVSGKLTQEQARAVSRLTPDYLAQAVALAEQGYLLDANALKKLKQAKVSDTLQAALIDEPLPEMMSPLHAALQVKPSEATAQVSLLISKVRDDPRYTQARYHLQAAMNIMLNIK